MTLLERLNDGGEVFLTHTTVGGQAVLRVAIGAPATTREHVERVWALLREGHDWLAADFAAAAERARAAAAPEAERAARRGRRAEEAQRAAEAEPAARDAPAEARRRRPVEDAAVGEAASEAAATRPTRSVRRATG